MPEILDILLRAEYRINMLERDDKFAFPNAPEFIHTYLGRGWFRCGQTGGRFRTGMRVVVLKEQT